MPGRARHRRGHARAHRDLRRAPRVDHRRRTRQRDRGVLARAARRRAIRRCSATCTAERVSQVAVAAPNGAAADAATGRARRRQRRRRRARGGAGDDGQRGRRRHAEFGRFVTVQPAAGAAYTVDGWMDMPGRDGVAAGRRRGTSRPSTAAVSTSPSARVGRGARCRRRDRARRTARRPAAVARDRRAGDRRARDGFRLGAASRFYLAYVARDIFGWDPASHAALHDEDGAITDGPIVLPDLVRSLELIAEDGPSALHTGELARLISADVIARGGLLGHGRPRRVPARRASGAGHADGRLGAGDGATAVGRRRVPGGDAAAARRRPHAEWDDDVAVSAGARAARRARAPPRRPGRERRPRRRTHARSST